MNSIGQTRLTESPRETPEATAVELDRWKADLRGFLSNACSELNRLIDAMEREMQSQRGGGIPGRTTPTGGATDPPVESRDQDERHPPLENHPSDTGNKMPWWKY